MTPSPQFPLSIRVPILLIGLYVLVCILSATQSIILPVLYAIIIAMLMSPAVNFLVKKKINRVIAVALVLLLTVLVLLGLVLLMWSQASHLVNAWPNLVLKFNELLEQSIGWIAQTFNISELSINTWISEAKADLMAGSNAAIASTINSMGSTFGAIFLTPVYIFMILFYQPHLVEFTHRLFGVTNDEKVKEIITVMETVIKSYLVGLFIEAVIVAVLNSIGMLVLGINYAILLGVLGAVLNVIPYLGGVIAMGIFAIVALVTKTPIYILYVMGLYSVIQFIDNNYIVPKVVGSKVQLNALFSLIAVILGAVLWGIPGMFISIPIAAILKLVFDRVDTLKPWGFLLGDIVQTSRNKTIGLKIKTGIHRIFNKKQRH